MPAVRGAVFTKNWLAELMLDLAGLRAGSGLIDRFIVEPACGEGAFLKLIAQRLAAEIKLSGRPWTDLIPAAAACDIDPAAVQKARQSVIETLIGCGCPLPEAERIAQGWVRLGDYLESALPPADFIVGNPPYIRAAQLDKTQRAHYCAKFPAMTKGADLYVGFYAKALDNLKPQGRLCFVCPDRWLQNAYGRKLRAKVSAGFSLDTVIRLHGVSAFESKVCAYPAVTLITNTGKAAGTELKFIDCAAGFTAAQIPALKAWLASGAPSFTGAEFTAARLRRPLGGSPYILGSRAEAEFALSAQQRLPSLEETHVKAGIGIATGCDKVFITRDKTLVEPSRLLPLFDPHAAYAEAQRFLVNPWEADGTLVRLDKYPKLNAYFTAHRRELSCRHIAKAHPEAWYRTIDKYQPELLSRPLLILPDLATAASPKLVQGQYPPHNCCWLCSDAWDLKVLGGLLISEAVQCLLKTAAVKMRGGTLRFQAQYLRLLHLPPPESLSLDLRVKLARAFEACDREAASHYAAQAFKEALT